MHGLIRNGKSFVRLCFAGPTYETTEFRKTKRQGSSKAKYMRKACVSAIPFLKANVEEVTQMNMPSFTAEASLYNSIGSYRVRSVSSPLANALHMQQFMQQLSAITLEPSPCQVICERFFENGVSFERCRVECPTDDGGDGGGDSVNCRERCREMGLSQFECMRLCMGLP